MSLNFQALYMRNIRFGISQLKKYQYSVEAFLESEKSSLSEALQEIEDGSLDTNEDHYHALYASVQAEYDEFAGYFPNTLRSSIIVQSYSFFEHHLKMICNRIYNGKKTVSELPDWKKGSVLKNAKVFLKESCHINISIYRPEWDITDNFTELRNIIIHWQGEYEANKKLDAFIKKLKPSVETICKQNNIKEIVILDEKLNLLFLDSIESFFNKLTTDIFNEK